MTVSPTEGNPSEIEDFASAIQLIDNKLSVNTAGRTALVDWLVQGTLRWLAESEEKRSGANVNA